MTELHVVFGTGQVDGQLIERLVARGLPATVARIDGAAEGLAS
jgi:hypothetical protein